jgi:hypothetical protein
MLEKRRFYNRNYPKPPKTQSRLSGNGKPPDRKTTAVMAPKPEPQKENSEFKHVLKEFEITPVELKPSSEIDGIEI